MTNEEIKAGDLVRLTERWSEWELEGDLALVVGWKPERPYKKPRRYFEDGEEHEQMIEAGWTLLWLDGNEQGRSIIRVPGEYLRRVSR